MAKRTVNPNINKVETKLNKSKQEFIENLEERIKLGQEIYDFPIKNSADLEKNRLDFNKWSDYNSELLKQSFNVEYNEYKKRYDDAGVFNFFIVGGRQESAQEKIQEFKQKIHSKLNNLQLLLGKVELLKTNYIEEIPTSISEVSVSSSKIFIVHGHNDKVKLDVTRTIEKLELNPIILHEQANGGKTIIEKFEDNSSEVGFAIVILTCDDKLEDEKFRARQNVVFEMGYFIGKLGRNKVALLYENGIELPSDINGLVYILIDDSGHWKYSIVKELKECGYNVDANKIL